MKQRNVGVDIAKALGIMMVVACHANFAPASPFRFFHMALFFFLTGWLSTFESRFGSFVLAKIKHLYVPFVVCEMAFFLLHYLFPSETGLFVASSMPLQKDPRQGRHRHKGRLRPPWRRSGPESLAD